MSSLADISLPLLPDRYYHIFNQGNEKKPIFFEDKNYQYFLNKYTEYMHRYVDTMAYCLLDNHFHLFIKVKSHEDIIRAANIDFEKIDKGFYNRYVMAWLRENSMADLARSSDLTVFKKLSSLIPMEKRIDSSLLPHPLTLESIDFYSQLCSHLVSERMRRFLLSYSKSINSDRQRTGSLFQKAFRRKNLYETFDFKNLTTFIHCNPSFHDTSIDSTGYNWSSYKAIIEPVSTKILKNKVLSWFNGREQFMNFHDVFYKQRLDNLDWVIDLE